jgi:hypothetical protein
MFSNYFKNIIDKFSSPANDIDFIPYLSENKPLEADSPNYSNFLSLKDFISLDEISDDSFISSSISQIFDKSPERSLEDSNIEKELSVSFIELKNSSKDIDIKNDVNIFCSETVKNKEEKNIFKVIYPSNFDDSENKEDNNFIPNQKDILLAGKRRRFSYRRQRKYNRDNIRKKIKRVFFNCALIKKLNQKLESIGSNKYFEKFPQRFVSDIDQKRGQEIFAMTLKEILETKKIYRLEKKSGLNNYLHNLKVVQSEDIKENEEFKVILNKTVRELYAEYINSDEFKIGEINRLKKKNSNDDYINSYIYFSRHLLEFFSK